MKKHLMAFAAILLAIGLNAFTDMRQQAKEEDKSQTTYHWYRVNAAGQTTSSVLNSGTKRNKAYAMTNLVPDCNDDEDNCAFGSATDNLTLGTTIPTPADPNAIILETE